MGLRAPFLRLSSAAARPHAPFLIPRRGPMSAFWGRSKRERTPGTRRGARISDRAAQESSARGARGGTRAARRQIPGSPSKPSGVRWHMGKHQNFPCAHSRRTKHRPEKGVGGGTTTAAPGLDRLAPRCAALAWIRISGKMKGNKALIEKKKICKFPRK